MSALQLVATIASPLAVLLGGIAYALRRLHRFASRWEQLSALPDQVQALATLPGEVKALAESVEHHVEITQRHTEEITQLREAISDRFEMLPTAVTRRRRPPPLERGGSSWPTGAR